MMHKLFSAVFFIGLNIIIHPSFAMMRANRQFPKSAEDRVAAQDSGQYNHTMHARIMDNAYDFPAGSLEDLLQKESLRISEAFPGVRPPDISEPLEDCRVHMERLRDKREAGQTTGEYPESSNVESCLRDPRERSHRLTEAEKNDPSTASSISLEERRAACDETHLGVVRHVAKIGFSPEALVSQANLERRDACVARAEYDAVEHVERMKRISGGKSANASQEYQAEPRDVSDRADSKLAADSTAQQDGNKLPIFSVPFPTHGVYDHMRHAAIVQGFGNFPVDSPEKALQGYAVANLDRDYYRWLGVRTPLADESLEDCRVHAKRYKRISQPGTSLNDVRVESLNMVSCLRDPRKREDRMAQVAGVTPISTPMFSTESLEERKRACDAKHLGVARHVEKIGLSPESFVSQASLDRHAACMDRAEYDHIELLEKSKEVQKQRRKVNNEPVKKNELRVHNSSFGKVVIEDGQDEAPVAVLSQDCVLEKRETVRSTCQAQCDRELAQAVKKPRDPRLVRSRHNACLDDCVHDSAPKSKTDATGGQCKAKPINTPVKSANSTSFKPKPSQSAPSVPKAFGLSRADQNRKDVRRFASRQGQASAQPRPTRAANGNSSKQWPARPARHMSASGRHTTSHATEQSKPNSEDESKRLHAENTALKEALKKINNISMQQVREAVKSPFTSLRDVFDSEDPLMKMDYFARVGSTVASMIFKKHAHEIKTFISASYKFVGGASKGDLAAMLEGLEELFKIGQEGKPDYATIAILEAIQDLSRQMAEYQEQIMERFDRTDKFHEATLKTLARNFFSLHQETGDIRQALRNMSEQAKKDLATLQGTISETHATSQRHFGALTDSLTGYRIEEIDEIIEAASRDAEKKLFTEADFNKHAEKLTDKAVSRAAAAELTGDNVDITNMAAIQDRWGQSTKDLWKHPVFGNINLLSKYLERHTGSKHAHLVHPLIWHACTRTMVRLTHKLLDESTYPTSRDQQVLDLERLKKLYAGGKRIVDFMEQCSPKNGLDLLADYQKSLQRVGLLIAKEQKLYEQERAQELRDRHGKMIEAELVRLQLKAPAFDCPECVKETDKVLRPMREHHKYLMQSPNRWSVPIEYHGKKDTYDPNKRPHKVIATIAAFKEVSDVLKPQQLLKDRCKAYETNLRDQGSQHLAQIAINHGKNSYHPIRRMRVVFPADPENYSAELFMHYDDLHYEEILPQGYREAEELGLGTIRYEYSIESPYHHSDKDTKDFCLYVYYSENNSRQLIVSKSLPYKPSSLYNNNENVQHFWYGGIFPTEKDLVMAGSLANGATARSSQWHTLTKWGYFPSQEPHSAAHDTFHYLSNSLGLADTDKQEKIMQQRIEEFYAQERQKFCARIAEQAEPSRTSKIYKALQELDVKFKLLEGFMTFMFNELMYREDGTMQEEFARIHGTEVTYLKDAQAVMHYLDQYADHTTGLSQQAFVLPHIVATQKTIDQHFDGVWKSRFTIGFKRVKSTIDKLYSLIQACDARSVTIIEIDTKSEELVVVVKKLEQSNKQKALLEADKALLTQAMTEQRQEMYGLHQQMQLVQQEMQGLRQQMQLLMEMIAKMQKP